VYALSDYSDESEHEHAGAGIALAHQLESITRLIRDRFDTRLVEEGNATVPTWMILWALSSGEEISQRHLATICHMEAPTLTRHLERLTAQGVVRRQRDRRDRRIVRVSFTPDGRRHYLALTRITRELEAGIEALLSEEERSLMASLLGQCIDGLSRGPAGLDSGRPGGGSLPR
jgi:DNA-binding MarR family transcriptional regulator